MLFSRELAAYRCFNELEVSFVPRLLEWNGDELWLETERIVGATTFGDWMSCAPSNSFEPVIAQLIVIDKFLYEHRVNYLNSSPAILLVDEQFRLYITDFTQTFLDQRFQDILCERMIDSLSEQLPAARVDNVVRAMLVVRSSEFHRFRFRKVQNGILRSLRLFRPKRLPGR